MKTKIERISKEEGGRHCSCGKIASTVDEHRVFRCYKCTEQFRLGESWKEESEKRMKDVK